MDELGGLTSQIVEPLEKQVQQFNRNAAGAALNFFKRTLGTVTEPFFRKEMGERYYGRETHGAGILFWLGAAIFGYFLPNFSSLAAPLCTTDLLAPFAFLFHTKILPVGTGLAMAFFQAKLGWESLSLMEKYRNEGKAYHTRSRGVPRWGQREASAFIWLELWLLLFNLPIGVLFVVGYYMNSKLKSEQDAAIMSRYLDKMDSEIENEYLESAALGKCPTELTYLNHQLDPEMNPEVREKVAASLVGKPVLVVAKAPQRKTPPQPQKTETALSSSPTAARREGEDEPKPLTETAVEPPEEHIRTDRQNRPHNVNVPPPMEFAEFKKLWDLGIKIRRLFIIGAVIAVCLVAGNAAFRFVVSHLKQQIVATETVPLHSQKASLPTTVPAGSEIQNHPLETAPSDTFARSTMQTQPGQTRELIINEFSETMAAEFKKYSAFRDGCESKFRDCTSKIQETDSSYRQSLNEQYESIAKAYNHFEAAQLDYLNVFQMGLQSIKKNPNTNPQQILETVKTRSPKMEKIRQEINNRLDALGASITNATPKR